VADGFTVAVTPETATEEGTTMNDATTPSPTIVFVHGAFADASGWAAAMITLRNEGHRVIAPANPLRGLAVDAAYVRSFLETIPGPIVIVGHSYGGAVLTNAAAGNDNVKALVYIAAFALDEGESVGAANTLGGGVPEVVNHLVVRPFAGASVGDADAYIDPEVFHEFFCADLDDVQATVMALTQRPGSLGSLAEPSGVPAWRDTPSWYLVAAQDRTIPPVAQREMARRAGARTVEIDSSHVAMISHPDEVVELVHEAIATINVSA